MKAPGPNKQQQREYSRRNGMIIRRLLGYVAGKHKLRFTLVLLFILLSACANVAGALFLKTLVDDYIEPLLLTQNPVFDGLLGAILTMAAIYIVGALSSLLYTRFMVVITQSTLKEIRDDMFSVMQTLPIKYYDTHKHGDIMSCYTNDTDALMQMVGQSIPSLISSIVTIITVFFAMVFTSWIMTIVVVADVFLILFITKKISGKCGKYFIGQQKSMAAVDGYIEEMINGQKVVKVFCHEEKAKEKFDERNDELFRNANEANKYANILMPIMANLGYFLYVIVAILGGYLAINGIGTPKLTLGAVISFLQLTRSFTNPISQVSQQINFIVMAMAGADRIFTLMDQKPEEDHGVVTLVNAHISEDGTIREAAEHTGEWAWRYPHSDGTVTYTRLTGDVRFYDVDFAYVAGKNVLHGVTLYAEPGQKLAFVGATGAGKTTITNLINRFYDIADGKIRYDGININKIRKSDLRRSLGVVLQDVNLFTGTVKDNIRYGNLSASDEEVVAAAKLANAHDFISRLPDGYDTMLTANGANLSQGQRQLISIARAAIADPPVMILDEATSSIDTRTEAIVQRGMDQLMHGRTVFVIAHRLSTVRNSDAIMVLEHGRIIERGNHERLISERGKYYQLYTGAFELE